MPPASALAPRLAPTAAPRARLAATSHRAPAPRVAAPGRRRAAPAAAAVVAATSAAGEGDALRSQWAQRWAEASPLGSATAAADVACAKAALLRVVAGLDRGGAASPLERDAVEAAAAALEAAAASAQPDAVPFGERLTGLWRLVYSSTFAGASPGSQGFASPPGAGTPLRLGAVLQRISWRKALLDNIVELRLPAPLPLLPPLSVTATLAHSLEATQGSAVATSAAAAASPRGVRITFIELQLRVRGVKGARPLALPNPVRALGLEAALPEALRGGAFDTPFLDEELRVSRGDRGELRVFVRA